MELSNSLIKRFTEATRDKSDATAKTEAYGTVQSDGSVVLDGASASTPCTNTVSLNPGDRVIVKVVNHQAVVTGNLTSEALDATATDKRIDSKMEDVIEVVDEHGSRIVKVESDIEQAKDEILLKVNQTEFNEEMRKVGEKTASLDVTVGLIEGKVSETEWYTVGEDNLQDSSGNTILDSSGGNTVGITKITKESAIRQNADEIQLRVTNTAFNSLGGRVSTAESAITQQANQIASKVSQTDFNALGQRVSSAESKITQQAGQIASKVSQSSFDALSGRVSTAESAITQNANNINLKVSKGDVISQINLSSESATISASKISLTGYTTINNGFQVYSDGTVNMNSASASNLSVSGNSTIWGNLKLYSGLHTNDDSDIYLRGRIYLGDYPEGYRDPYNEMTDDLPYAYIGHSSDKKQLLIRPGTYKQWTGMDTYITVTHDVRLGTNSNPFSHIRANNFDTISDRKKKNHIEYISAQENSPAANLIYSLKPSMYTMKGDTNTDKPIHFGFYAQDVNAILPNDGKGYSVVMAETKDSGNLSRKEIAEMSDSDISWTLSYNELIAPLVAVVQQQKQEIDELRKRIDSLLDNKL